MGVARKRKKVNTDIQIFLSSDFVNENGINNPITRLNQSNLITKLNQIRKHSGLKSFGDVKWVVYVTRTYKCLSNRRSALIIEDFLQDHNMPSRKGIAASYKPHNCEPYAAYKIIISIDNLIRPFAYYDKVRRIVDYLYMNRKQHTEYALGEDLILVEGAIDFLSKDENNIPKTHNEWILRIATELNRTDNTARVLSIINHGISMNRILRTDNGYKINDRNKQKDEENTDVGVTTAPERVTSSTENKVDNNLSDIIGTKSNDDVDWLKSLSLKGGDIISLLNESIKLSKEYDAALEKQNAASKAMLEATAAVNAVINKVAELRKPYPPIVFDAIRALMQNQTS